MKQLVDILRRERCSLVVAKAGRVGIYHGRGVSDLYRLLNDEAAPMQGAYIADKVVGKGAAALMILGGAKEVYAGVISTSALNLFRSHGLTVSFGEEVSHIMNRAGDGLCPVEQLCRECTTAAACLPLIKEFITARANSKP